MSTGTGAGAVLAPAVAADRSAIEAILRRTGLLKEKEIEVALEVLDVYLCREGQDDYRVYTAALDGRIAGYVCFGPNSMTEGVFELYWIAVDPSFHRRGTGRSLMNLAEREAILAGGRKVAVETSSRSDYEPTLSFYRRLGYREEARVADFYSVGDDKVIFIKDLPSRPET